MNTAPKFLFDRDFDPDLLVGGEPRSGRRAGDAGRSRAKPAITEDDLARARAEGLAEGREQASRDAAQSVELRLTEAFETVGERLGEVISGTRAAHAAAAREATAVAVAIARRMVPELYRRNAAAEIELTVASVLSRVLETKELTVRAAEALAEPLRERITALAEARGIGERIRIAADPALPEGDCRIEWPGGGAERDSAALWTEIEAVIEKNLGFVPSFADGDKETADISGAVNEENTTPMLECAANAPSAEIEVGETHG
jgi:flagellar assembly protein FliH